MVSFTKLVESLEGDNGRKKIQEQRQMPNNGKGSTVIVELDGEGGGLDGQGGGLDGQDGGLDGQGGGMDGQGGGLDGQGGGLDGQGGVNKPEIQRHTTESLEEKNCNASGRVDSTINDERHKDDEDAHVRRQKTHDELRKEVDALKMEVQMAMARAYEYGEADVKVQLPEEAVEKGLTSPEDFEVKENSFTYENGASYEGEALGHMRHGQGTFVESNGSVYSGSWKYDVFEGKGRASMPDGSTYEGEWVGGNPHGHGVSTYPQGGTYEGDFEKGGRHGWGTMMFTSKERYEGEWENDVIHGQGRWTYQDGSYFEGEFARGSRVSGKFESHDGSEVYIGAWRDQKRWGEGTLVVKNIGRYEGVFENDAPHGEGKMQYIDGSVYEGAWQQGMRQGKGILRRGTFLYQGDWAEDMIHGKGLMMEENGDRYIGEFSHGERCGKGRMQYQDGTVYEGMWEAGKRHGNGVCKFSSGDKYEGEWKEDKRHGQGTCKFADGTKFRGKWEEDGWIQSGADPVKCRIGGAGTIRAEVGKTASFVIQARDELGNKRLNGGDEFQVHLILHGDCGNPDIDLKQQIISVSGEVKDNDDGTYEVAYAPTVSGVYELNVTLAASHEHVADSPYPVRVLASSPCMKTLLVQGEGKSKAECGSEAMFEILVRDKYGNRCFGQKWSDALPLVLKLQGSTQMDEITVATHATADGRLMCSYYAPKIPGYYRLHVEDTKGNAAPGTPYSVRIGPQGGSELSPKENKDLSPQAEDSETYDAAPRDPLIATTNIPDTGRIWETIAKFAYAQDGDTSGWDSDEGEKKETEEDAYIKSHPNVPVVENLEDLWLVSKLQQERKKKEEEAKQKKLHAIKDKLEGMYGPPTTPSLDEAKEAMQKILKDELESEMKQEGQQQKEDRVPSSEQKNDSIKGLQLKTLAAALDDLA